MAPALADGVDIGGGHRHVAVVEADVLRLSRRGANDQTELSELLGQVKGIAEQRWLGRCVSTGGATLCWPRCSPRAQQVLCISGAQTRPPSPSGVCWPPDAAISLVIASVRPYGAPAGPRAHVDVGCRQTSDLLKSQAAACSAGLAVAGNALVGS